MLLPVVVSEIAGEVAKSVDPDQIPCFVAFDLELHCLLKQYRIYPKFGAS